MYRKERKKQCPKSQTLKKTIYQNDLKIRKFKKAIKIRKFKKTVKIDFRINSLKFTKYKKTVKMDFRINSRKIRINNFFSRPSSSPLLFS